jgi:integrase
MKFLLIIVIFSVLVGSIPAIACEEQTRFITDPELPVVKKPKAKDRSLPEVLTSEKTLALFLLLPKKVLPLSNALRKLALADEEIKCITKDKQITEQRAQVVEHHLVSLVKFWELKNKPQLDELSRLYEFEWQNWRSSHKAQKTGKTLSARYRNNEQNTHKMFFRWCEGRRYSSRIPKIENLKVERTNSPFPQEYYQKLLAVTRQNVKDGRNPRIRWELMNYRYVILLMAGIGCRVLECKNLRWRDIDVRKNGVYLYIYGKSKERTIRIPDRIYGHLMDLRKYKEENSLNYNSTDFPHVFNTWKSHKATKHYAGEVRRRWMTSTGMPDPDDYELVCFRHKFITDALNNGAHSLTIASYCGTSQLMIEKTYSGLVAAQVYDLVFRNTPGEALERKKTPKWLELSEEENTSIK